jgi:acetyl-CoA carboxylase biotin carboxyl carrier protein
MTVDEIKELIKVVNESGIAELEVQRGNDRVRIQRTYPPAANEAPAAAAVYTLPPTVSLAPQAPVIASVAAAPPQLSGNGAAQQAPAAEEETVLVKSPIVGTFYESPSPGTAPFVRIGDRVSPGQVLCIIESMKLMNEIEAEVSGTIVSRLVENGRPVEYGEALFAVKPN